MSKDPKRRHVFISHHHKDDANVDKMTNLLKGNGCDIRNSSIRAKPANQERLDKGLVKDAVIKRLLRMKVSWAGAVVVLIGKDTHKRPWVNWEIKQAHEQGKRIVGVWEQGGQAHELPENLKKYGSAVVGWQADRIIDAIDGKINDWTDPAGQQYPARDIPPAPC
ncbi:TIR domain-containing protein [Mariniblastus sp.]|nr:TIR domain-containing protein [Mariniblastus sp.]